MVRGAVAVRRRRRGRWPVISPSIGENTGRRAEGQPHRQQSGHGDPWKSLIQLLPPLRRFRSATQTPRQQTYRPRMSSTVAIRWMRDPWSTMYSDTVNTRRYQMLQCDSAIGGLDNRLVGRCRPKSAAISFLILVVHLIAADATIPTRIQILLLRIIGIWLVVASALFWIAWVLMPGVGVTDAQEFLNLVAQQRPQVRLSAIVQLASAAAYAPALVGVAGWGQYRKSITIEVGAILLLIGAMGSAADAIFHLVAYEMTAPDAAREALIPVLARLQGPDLVLIAPMLVAFVVGSVILAIGFVRVGVVTTGSLIVIIAFVAVVVIVGRVFGLDPSEQRIVGLGILGLLSLCQVWLGLGLWKLTPG